ncbi:unnamed protein product [Closterium sp. NIES-53]
MSPCVYGPTFPPPISSLARLPPCSQLSPPQPPDPSPASHHWVRRPSHACPMPPLPRFHSMLLRSRPLHVLPLSVLPPPPPSSLTIPTPPFSCVLHVARPMFSRVLSSLVIDPSAPPPSVSVLVATVTDLASTCRLDYATQFVCTPTHPPSVGGAPTLGSDVLQDRQFELAFLATAAPYLCTILLAL